MKMKVFLMICLLVYSGLTFSQNTSNGPGSSATPAMPADRKRVPGNPATPAMPKDRKSPLPGTSSKLPPAYPPSGNKKPVIVHGSKNGSKKRITQPRKSSSKPHHTRAKQRKPIH